jgi:hypothetical protein
VIGRPKSLGQGDGHLVGLAFHLGPEGTEDLDMGVDLPGTQGAAGDILLDSGMAKPVQQGRDQHQDRAHPHGQVRAFGVQLGMVMDPQGAGLKVHIHAGAELAVEVQDLADIGNVRNPMKHHRGLGQQGGAEHRQDGVLVGRGRDLALQGPPATHDQIGHQAVLLVRGGVR